MPAASPKKTLISPRRWTAMRRWPAGSTLDENGDLVRWSPEEPSAAGTRLPLTSLIPRSQRESVMAVEVDSSGGGGNVLIGFLLGAVLIAVAIVGFFMW